MHVLLFMTRGMSLAAWKKNGSLTRELALYKKMSEQGVAVSIISWGDRRELEVCKEFPWLRIYGNFYNLSMQRYERLMPILHAWPLIQADIIKTNQTNGADCALRCAQFWHKPLVARCGYVWSEFCRNEYPKDLKHALAVEKEVFSKADKGIVTTVHSKKYLAEIHNVPLSRFICIPNYVPNNFFAARLPEYHSEVKPSILQVGRLAPQKNLFALVEACKGLDVTLKLVGEGEEKQALLEAAHQHGVKLEVLGNVDHAQLPELLRQSTVCTLVSRFEGHPKALIEYMACGCPVLATNAPGLSNVVEHNVTGLLCDTDVVSIRVGLQSLLSDAHLRQKLGTQARKAAARYSLEVILKKELKEYNDFPILPPKQRYAQVAWSIVSFLKRIAKRFVFRIKKSNTDFCEYSVDSIKKFVSTKTPAEALEILFSITEKLYPLQGHLAVAYDNGIHTKHRHTKYHDFFINRIQENEKVLDIGCGNGFLAFDIAVQSRAHVTGIELEAANVAIAQSSFSHPHVKYMQGNALTDIQNESYDTVVLSNVLEHLPDRWRFLAQLQERLKPKRFLLRVPLLERDWQVPLKKELGMEWRLDPTHETEYTYESFVYELCRAGLAITYKEIRWGEIWCEVTSHIPYVAVVPQNPPVTVLMVVHNGKAYVEEAIISILRQTMPRFDFLIVDDASTDGTAEILKVYAQKDARIKILTNESNLGLTASLNHGIFNIHTPYIARMDADDLALPERLALQLYFMEKNRQVAAAGCFILSFDGDEPLSPPVQWNPPVSFHAIREQTFQLGPQLSHPGSILRTEPIKSVGGYREAFKSTQDYDLWLRLLDSYELGNVPAMLLLYRNHVGAVSQTKVTEQTINHVLAMQSSEYRRQGKADPLIGKKLNLELLKTLLDPLQSSCYVWFKLLTNRSVKDKDILIFEVLDRIVRQGLDENEALEKLNLTMD